MILASQCCGCTSKKTPDSADAIRKLSELCEQFGPGSRLTLSFCSQCVGRLSLALGSLECSGTLTVSKDLVTLSLMTSILDSFCPTPTPSTTDDGTSSL